MEKLFAREIGVYDDLCQTWRVVPSTDYMPAAQYVVKNKLNKRDGTWYAAMGLRGKPVDLNEEELSLLEKAEYLLSSIGE
jgi:hypothetical protein